MAEKNNMYGRVQQKHDIEANWIKATGFTPKAGEIIVYDPDEVYTYARVKIGDGNTLVNNLPFMNSGGGGDIDTESLKNELKAYCDELILGGSW